MFWTSVHWINNSYLFGNMTNQILFHKMESNILIKAKGIKAKYKIVQFWFINRLFLKKLSEDDEGLEWCWGSWGLELRAKKEFLKKSLVEKSGFIKAQDLPMGRKSCIASVRVTILWSRRR